ncbi:MAG: hypothetical protein EOO77_18890 [Oxalobacteraceae bacterium]|nr:MAG: hypothetical protein EOO77_18890 [Oxalobacteraceae bacterium]
MRKSVLIMAGMAATVLGAPAAYANVICIPGSCVDADTGAVAPKASFIVTPMNVDASYRGPISASLGNTVTTRGTFTDTFNFLLPTNGVGGGSVTTVAASFKGATDLDFTSVLINGVSAAITRSTQGIVEFAFGSGITLSAGANLISVSGLSRGSGSYGGSISFTPSVPETATWGMMILGFMGMGAAMRYRRKSAKVVFA